MADTDHKKQSQDIHAWLGRPIASEKHALDLDRFAAVNEFHHKQPRHIAEDNAYKQYTHEQHVEAAAHHLAGMKAAHGAGAMDSARKHGLRYELHLKKLGHDKYGPVPPEIQARHESSMHDGSSYEFKHHTGDEFLLDGAKPLGEAKQPK